MAAFRIHTVSGAVLTVPTGQFASIDALRQALLKPTIADNPFAPNSFKSVVSETLTDALKLGTVTTAKDCCLRRESVVVIEQL